MTVDPNASRHTECQESKNDRKTGAKAVHSVWPTLVVGVFARCTVDSSTAPDAVGKEADKGGDEADSTKTLFEIQLGHLTAKQDV